MNDGQLFNEYFELMPPIELHLTGLSLTHSFTESDSMRNCYIVHKVADVLDYNNLPVIDFMQEFSLPLNKKECRLQNILPNLKEKILFMQNPADHEEIYTRIMIARAIADKHLQNTWAIYNPVKKNLPLCIGTFMFPDEHIKMITMSLMEDPKERYCIFESITSGKTDIPPTQWLTFLT